MSDELIKAGALAGLLALAASASPLAAGSLEESVGRSEVRVYSAAYELRAGLSVADAALADRLEALGYRRVGRKPERLGEFFWGHEVFWIYRRPYRRGGQSVPASLLRLPLDPSTGRILALPEGVAAVIEPVLLAESLDGDRAARRPVDLEDLPEHLWRAVLAAEDARFFEHPGVDARALARALVRNAQAGRVVQGGSTITQQLIKNRDLTPRRRLGRKLSEAVRALRLESEYSKEEILQAYLNSVYLGHVGGLAVHGVGAAARAYFGKPAAALGLGESALLAAMIQGPNRLHPGRHPRAALERQRWVLERLEELAWVEPAALAGARRGGLPRLVSAPPPAPPARAFVRWVEESLGDRAARRLEKGRGVVVETTLDPYLQAEAERAVRAALAGQRRAGRRPEAALVSIDAVNGDVVAYVAGDPDDAADRFDRVRQARRQPGSAIKPLVLLEAFADCGEREPLYASRRVLDEPVRLDLPSGPWRPENFDRRYRGVVDLRESLVRSLNVPFVRVGRWCGFEAMAGRLRRAGLELPSAGAAGARPGRRRGVAARAGDGVHRLRAQRPGRGRRPLAPGVAPGGPRAGQARRGLAAHRRPGQRLHHPRPAGRRGSPGHRHGGGARRRRGLGQDRHLERRPRRLVCRRRRPAGDRGLAGGRRWRAGRPARRRRRGAGLGGVHGPRGGGLAGGAATAARRGCRSLGGGEHRPAGPAAAERHPQRAVPPWRRAAAAAAAARRRRAGAARLVRPQASRRPARRRSASDRLPAPGRGSCARCPRSGPSGSSGRRWRAPGRPPGPRDRVR